MVDSIHQKKLIVDCFPFVLSAYLQLKSKSFPYGSFMPSYQTIPYRVDLPAKKPGMRRIKIPAKKK
jgi:hypothetical protein